VESKELETMDLIIGESVQVYCKEKSRGNEDFVDYVGGCNHVTFTPDVLFQPGIA